MKNYSPDDCARIGLVVIGRNEGDRLVRCLESAQARADQVVYVDSGSTDDSVAMALKRGVEVVRLDMSTPFTAARARNEGFFRLLERAGDRVAYVQFVDGDCELVPGWIERATHFLDEHPEVAAVCGRRRERHPERSIYNWMCDIEWDTRIGETRSVGGDALMRIAAFTKAGGYRADMIAGEEPELCVRLRKTGWLIWRLDEEMTRHDAAMTRLGQWWKRTTRAGHAFAEGAHLHGRPPVGHCRRETRRALLWGAGLPVGIAAAGLVVPALWLLALIYPLQVFRLALREEKKDFRTRWARSFFLVLGRFPEAQGVLTYWKNHVLSRRSLVIEYK